MITWLQRIAFLCALALMIDGCATGGITYVNHGLKYDMAYDSQDAKVLDLKYKSGSSVIYGVPDAYVQLGTGYGADSTFGPMPRGTTLYVKWRNRTSGAVYEDMVDLRRRLPSELTDKIIYIMIWGSQLYIFVLSDEPKPEGQQVIGPSSWATRNVEQIYPDQKRQ